MVGQATTWRGVGCTHRQERATAAERAKLKQGLRRLRTQDVVAMLEFAAAPLADQDVDLPYLRRTLAALVRRVELDPAARTTCVHYAVGLGGVSGPTGIRTPVIANETRLP
jgi:hypothetical protein